MSELILHHYDLSPFSEKVRRVLAYKNVPWRAVEQPVMAPKPELTPLTGGYRRIPVLQIGADIYCDTALIVRRIEALHPHPSVLPTAQAGLIAMIEDWADHRVFMQVVPPTIVALVDVLPPGFIEDRKAMSAGFSLEALTAAAPQALAQACHVLDYLDAQLGGSEYLLGAGFTLADAACFHTVRFMMNNPALVPLIEARANVAAWVKRIEGFGSGKVTPMSGADALAAAAAARPADTAGTCAADAGFSAGQLVTISADDYGQETTTGKVARISANEITVLREDPTLGEVAVHYPRAGYRISAGG